MYKVKTVLALMSISNLKLMLGGALTGPGRHVRAACHMLQMGAPVGQVNERKEGWAWVDTQPGQDTEILEAYRLADLVSNTLRLEVCLDGDLQEGSACCRYCRALRMATIKTRRLSQCWCGESRSDQITCKPYHPHFTRQMR